MLVSVVSVGLALLTQVGAVVVENHVMRAVLNARQEVIDPDSVPGPCRSMCAPTVQAFNGCPTNACICTNEVMSATANCFSCVISVDGPPSRADLAQAQETLQEIEDQCFEVGDPVQSFTVSAIGGIATATTGGGGGGGSISLPAAGSISQSIFFSSGTGAPGGASVTPTPTLSSPPAQTSAPSVSLPPQSGPPHTTVTSLSTPIRSPSSTPLNPTAPPGTSGAAMGVSILSSLALAGVVGGVAFVFAL